MSNNIFINEPGDEDTIQCLFFAPNEKANSISLNLLSKKINIDIQFLAQDYLWHKNAFHVLVPVNEKNKDDLPPYLTSSTMFGDNIEDEWFIVYIILELTKLHKDLIVQIQDNDGDFLLIEAADHLPQWANPESTENRVFIHNSHIHLIPPNIASLDVKLILNDAINHILNTPEQTMASAEIERAILNRIGNYPNKIKENIHNALVKVPLEIGVLLKLKPNLIAPIVDAYCHHDSIDAKSFKNISCNNWVEVTVKFTKCLYAMLLYSKLANTIRQPIKKEKKMNLGIKLACGYQMITKRSSNIFSSKEYMKFINSLKDNGYFNNNIEGSKEYNMKLDNAKEFFSAVECPIASNVSSVITEVMASDDFNKTKELLQNGNDTGTVEQDNDDWLTLHPEQLNQLLNSRYGKKTTFQKGDVLTPQNVTSELNKFLNHTSDFEGIETKTDISDNNIDFDADEFENCIDKMLKLLSGNQEEVESIDSDFSDEMSMSEGEHEVDMELKEKLHGAADNLSNSDTIVNNFIKSMKEEKASVGPSSSMITNVGLKKSDFLDSDDYSD